MPPRRQVPSPFVPEEVTSSAAASASGSEKAGRRPLRSEIRIGAVVAIAVAIGLIVWLIVGRGDSNNNKSEIQDAVARGFIGPTAASQQEMAAYSKAIGQPIYWMGPKADYTYELTRTTAG